MTSALPELAREFVARLGSDAVVTDRVQLRTYECDGLAAYRCVPGLVVLPRTTDEVSYVVRRCHDAGIPFVARGAGTGLSGGALPREDGVLIVLSRMSRIREVDVDDEENRRLKSVVANLSVDNELLREKIARLEGNRPLAFWKSKP